MTRLYYGPDDGGNRSTSSIDVIDDLLASAPPCDLCKGYIIWINFISEGSNECGRIDVYIGPNGELYGDDTASWLGLNDIIDKIGFWETSEQCAAYMAELDLVRLKIGSESCDPLIPIMQMRDVPCNREGSSGGIGGGFGGGGGGGSGGSDGGDDGEFVAEGGKF